MDLFPCGGAGPVDRWPAPMSASALLGRRGVGGALAPLLVRRSGAVLEHREGRRRRFRRPGGGGHEGVPSLSGVIVAAGLAAPASRERFLRKNPIIAGVSPSAGPTWGAISWPSRSNTSATGREEREGSGGSL